MVTATGIAYPLGFGCLDSQATEFGEISTGFVLFGLSPAPDDDEHFACQHRPPVRRVLAIDLRR